jgi:hypothetical protein
VILDSIQYGRLEIRCRLYPELVSSPCRLQAASVGILSALSSASFTSDCQARPTCLCAINWEYQHDSC